MTNKNQAVRLAMILRELEGRKTLERLEQMLEQLEEQADHTGGKGGSCICLVKEEYEGLFAIIRNAINFITAEVDET